MKTKKEEKKFNYAVGHYWSNGNGSVGCYCLFSEVHFGTMKNAKNFLEYVKEKDKTERKENRKDWKIFMLVEVPTE
jgi:hypothetical protein